MNDGPSKRYVHPEPLNVALFGKRFSADVFKDVEMSLPKIIQVGPKCKDKCPFKRKAENDLRYTERKVM